MFLDIKVIMHDYLVMFTLCVHTQIRQCVYINVILYQLSQTHTQMTVHGLEDNYECLPEPQSAS